MYSKSDNYSDEEILKILNESKSFREVLIKLERMVCFQNQI